MCSCKEQEYFHTLAHDDEHIIRMAMKTGPYSIVTDGSTEYDDKKLYPIVVCYFDDVQMRVVCVLKLLESSVSTGEAIYSLIDDFTQNCIDWDKSLSFGADNAAVMRMLGKGMARHPHVYLLDCPCHLIHLPKYGETCSSAHCKFKRICF